MSEQKSIQERANENYAARFDDEMRQLLAIVGSYKGGEVNGEEMSYEDAIERLEEMPLSFAKLITNHREETITWEILLGTGGPADRVVVVTDYSGMIESAEYQFQDWFEPWTAAENQDATLVQRFADIVGYYEDAS